MLYILFFLMWASGVGLGYGLRHAREDGALVSFKKKKPLPAGEVLENEEVLERRALDLLEPRVEGEVLPDYDL